MKNVYVDGSYGTVGLSISRLLKKHSEIRLLEIPESEKKDAVLRKQLISQADLVALCLPEDSISELISQIPETAKLVDCSTKFRCDDAWVYGLPELSPKQRNLIRTSHRVANPGCFATAFVLIIRPLITKGFISTSSVVSAFALTGYSAGGKKMIEQKEIRSTRGSLNSLGMDHKHLPEMKKFTGLQTEPLFIPAIGTHKEGLLLTVPLNLETHREKLISLYREQYGHEKTFKIHDNPPHSLTPNCLENNQIDLYVGGTDNRFSVTIKLNNLMKGAAANALQCINLMLGFDEWTGLP